MPDLKKLRVRSRDDNKRVVYALLLDYVIPWLSLHQVALILCLMLMLATPILCRQVEIPSVKTDCSVSYYNIKHMHL